MIKQKLTYVDFNGLERTEDFYFHLSLPEAVRLEAKLGNPLDKHAQLLSANKDMNGMIEFLEEVLLNSYGVKTEDGRSFKKSPQLREEFEYSNAYAELFQLLLTTPELARKFGEGVADNGKGKKNQIAPEVKLEK